MKGFGVKREGGNQLPGKTLAVYSERAVKNGPTKLKKRGTKGESQPLLTGEK